MKKRIVLLTGLLCLTALQGLIVSNALADDSGTFTTMWVIDLPRSTYFIGETVTFTVTAFASTDPSLLLPDQMAQITIRNASMVEVYATWITTNSNGSAPVSWESSLNASAENYTIILDDLKTPKITATFNLLYNEETYWQTRVGDLEKQLQTQYNYLNFLFSYQKYQQNQLAELKRQLQIFGILAFVTVMCALYVGMHEMAGSKRNASGILSYGNVIKEVLGFRARPIVELDHEEIASVVIPASKVPPIYGHTFSCPVCDPEKKNLMTEDMLKDHLWAKHDRLHLKKDSIMAKHRARKAERQIEAKKKANEEPNLTLVSVDKAKEEWKEQTIKEKAQARLDEIKRQQKNGEISKEETARRLAQLKADLTKTNEKPNETTSAKPVLSRKVRGERQLSMPISSVSGNSQKEAPKTPASTTQPKTQIDDLFDKLSNEKVN